METAIATALAELDVTPRHRDVVARHLAVLEPEIEPIAHRFYAHMRSMDIGRNLDDAHADRLFAARVEHWRSLLRGDFGAVASDHADRFGRNLFEAGLPARILVAAAARFTGEMLAFVDASADIPAAEKTELAVALAKLAHLDVVLAHVAQDVAYLD